MTIVNLKDRNALLVLAYSDYHPNSYSTLVINHYLPNSYRTLVILQTMVRFSWEENSKEKTCILIRHPYHPLFPVLLDSLDEPTKCFSEGQLLSTSQRVPFRMVDVGVDDEVELLLRDLSQVDGDDGVERRRLRQVTLRWVPVIASLRKG